MCQLSIIIVNYNTPVLTTRCIESIQKSSFDNYEVIVVDNNSQDNSLAIIQATFPKVLTIQNDSNEGFGRANNLGAKHAQGEYLLFLNSDMLLKSDTLSICYKEISKKKDVGVLSCQLFNEDGSIQRSLFYDSGTYKNLLEENLVLDKLFDFKKGKVRAVIGAYMLIPAQVFKKVGGFDSDFFMYSEELLLCDRIREAGYKIVQTIKTHAIHKHGGSTTDGLWSKRQKLVSSQLYYRKKHGFIGFLFYHCVMLFNYFTNFIAMWWIDSGYRKSNFFAFKNYCFSWKYLCSISFFLFRKNNGFLKVK